jgi:hypothetical protein
MVDFSDRAALPINIVGWYRHVRRELFDQVSALFVSTMLEKEYRKNFKACNKAQRDRYFIMRGW